MADSFKKKAVTEESAPEKPADAWKDAVVEKEHQPVKVKSDVTYRQMENEIVSIAAQVKSLGERKTVVEAEMAEIKKAAQG
jgi:hypothetical protein